MEVKLLKNLLLIIALAVVTKWSIGMLDWLGYFQHIYNHAPGQCRKLPGIEFGSEDIQVMPNGIAFISSGLRLRDTDVYKSRPGRIYTFDFNRPNEAPRELVIKGEKDFVFASPHGISTWTDDITGDVYLYVISHHPVEIIDKFMYEERTNSLMHMKRLAADHNFHKLNDLAIVGDDKFFFTNYYYAYDKIEFPLGLRWASLGFYDGSKSRLVEKRLEIANGLALSPDRKYLYMAHGGPREIRVYNLHANNSISFLNAIQLNTNLDNLDVDATTGDIWVGAHPVAYKVLQYMDDPRELSPSQVLRVRMSKGKATSIHEIYADDGSVLSGSTVAVLYKRALLIGTITGPALYCDLRYSA